MPNFQVVAIIPCLGKVEETRKCILSLLKNGMGIELKILVVENGSTDNTRLLKPEFMEVDFLSLPENQGFACAINQGIGRAQNQWHPEFYFLLNNDAEIRENSLQHLVKTMKGNAQCGIAAPKILANEAQGILWAAGGEWIPWRFLARNRHRGQKASTQYEPMLECRFLPGCALLVRREVVETVGLLDESYFLYAEDLDYSLRAQKNGWKLLYDPMAVVIHEGNITSGGEYEPFQSFYRWRNRFLAAWKHAGIAHRIFLYGLFFPLLMARDSVTYVRKGQVRSIPYLWRGFFQFLVLIGSGSPVVPLKPQDFKTPSIKKLRSGYLFSNPLAIVTFKGLDFLGRCLFRLKRKKTVPKTLEKILITKIDHLGDVLLALHLVPAIKRSFPQCRIHFLCGSWSRAVLLNHPLIERAFEFDDLRLNRKGTFWERLWKMARDIANIVEITRREEYDLVLDLRAYYPNSIPLLALSNAKCLAGFLTGGFGFLLDVSTSWREGIHESEHFYDLWKCIDPHASRTDPDLSYLVNLQQTQELQQNVGLKKRDSYIILHAFCQKSFLHNQKHWILAEWKKLIAYFEKEGIQVFCTGDASDEVLVKEMIVGSRAVNLAGKTPLPVLAGLLKQSLSVYCVDTFVAHLSAALGARTNVIFNEVEPVEQWKPWGKNVHVFPIESRSEDLIVEIKKLIQNHTGVLSHG